MNVAERDPVIHAWLREERRRSGETLQGLLAKARGLPKGALNVRRKEVHGRVYRYHYLVLREGRKVVNRHVAERDVALLQRQLAEREECLREIRICRQRLVYLERLLR